MGGLAGHVRVDSVLPQACADAGVDYVEIGYKADEGLFSRDEYGKWRFCTEDDVRSACIFPSAWLWPMPIWPILMRAS